jgi:L-ascorbate metabolism protein UlaG (beta-lactamase superfamily)
MRTIVREYFGANLAVINIGDIFTTGPEAAAFAVEELIRPASVIPSHVNEAATQGGVAVGARTSLFQDLLSRKHGHGRKDHGVSVLLPLSGVTMEFNERGRCEAGCQGQ